MTLKNAQYHQIIRKYEDIQLKNRHLLDTRFEEIAAEIPEIMELEAGVSKASVEQGRKLLLGDTKALEDLKERLAEIAGKREQLLIANGYPADYLSPIYDCKDCQDTGYIGNQKCHCFKKAAAGVLLEQSNLGQIISQENFDAFRYDFYKDDSIDPVTGMTPLSNIKKAVSISKVFIDSFPDTYQNMFIYGKVGRGKSFLCNCIAKELMENGFSILYYTAFQLFDQLAKKNFNSNDISSENDFYEQLFSCDLLIIDDLGTELTNSFVSSQLFLCINERHLRKRSTIISTNLPLEKIRDIYSERTFSRISSSYILLKIIGDDIRIMKKLKGINP